MRENPVLAALGAYPIAELQALARSIRESGRRLIDFSIGDPVEPTPEFIRDELRRSVPAVSQYPTVRGLASLRQAVAGYVSRRFGVDVDPDTQVLPTAGSKEAIFTTPLGFVDRDAGDVGVFATPGYPIHERGIRFAGASAVGAMLSGDFVLRPDDIPAQATRGLRLVWTCSPHNPSGAVTTLADLASLYEWCRERDVLLLSDEPYTDLYGDTVPSSALEAAGHGSPGLLSFLSCSKRSGMTGYRSGAIVGDAAAIRVLADLRSSVGVASPEFIQAAATVAWGDDEHVAQRRSVFAQKRSTLRTPFEEAGIEVVGSDAGIYLWVVVDDDAVAAKRLLEEGVVVSPGRVFGPGGEGHLRFALVPTVEECAAAAEVVVSCLTSGS
jgi:succinyldiaminopimelate transaminase